MPREAFPRQFSTFKKVEIRSQNFGTAFIWRPPEPIPSANLGQKLKSKKVAMHGLRHLEKHCQDGFRRLNKFKFEVKILEQHSFGGPQRRFLAQI